MIERSCSINDFVRESNLIEGIVREPMPEEVGFVGDVLTLDRMTTSLLEDAVEVFEPGAKLRDKVGMDVRVGSHIAPPGGPGIKTRLMTIVGLANGLQSPYSVHCDYECLHPFMDGNGRSGRLLWLWMMVKRDGHMPPLGFLHTFYYQTLATSR